MVLLKLPERIGRVLHEDQALVGVVFTAASNIEPLLASRTPLFPEYTDHGLPHVETVLATAESLISTGSWTSLTPADMAALALATLIHDLAMHLTEDGFRAMLEANSDLLPLGELDFEPWTVLWDRFLGQASRFNARELLRLFGDTSPSRRPPSDPIDWTKRDRLLVGEFLRRQHHRLAHEVALLGLPTPSGFTRFLPDMAPHMADLAGLVARSHGVDLRSLLPYLETHYDRREYRGVHAVYLMSLLRLSDHMHIGSDRAPEKLRDIQRLCSPRSEREWLANQAVKDIRQVQDDPEAIHVDAEPADAQTFVQLSGWLHALQEELDNSWAVIGEVYGRVLPNLGFVLRRVKSNLDDVGVFASTVDYYPVRAAIEVESPDLVKLMVGPLYGDCPGYGIRELLQNAVDAIRERTYLESASKAGGMGKHTGSVSVSLQQDEVGATWLTVQDDGVGMTSDVVTHYFLKVGASYRRSEAWQKEFEDSHGRAQIARSGRFGIGVAAAFLLGPQVRVSTRHVRAPETEGVIFQATLDSEVVELRRARLPAGTTVGVRLSRAALDRLAPQFSRRPLLHPEEFDDISWFCESEPAVSIVMDSGTARPPLRMRVPSPYSPLPREWRRTAHADFADILWAFKRDCPGLICNGIAVREVERPTNLWVRSLEQDKSRPVLMDTAGEYVVSMPNISVCDPDGFLPLNLQRTDLAHPLPFLGQLKRDVLADLAGLAIATAPSKHLLHDRAGNWFKEAHHAGLTTRVRRPSQPCPSPWVWADGEVTFLDRDLLEEYSLTRLILVAAWPTATNPMTSIEPGTAVIALPDRGGGWAADVAASMVRGPFCCGLKCAGGRILTSDGEARALLRRGALPDEVRGSVRLEWESDNPLRRYQAVAVGECQETQFRIDALLSDDSPHDLKVAECFLGQPSVRRGSSRSATRSEPSEFAQIWLDLLGRPGIPCDRKEREVFEGNLAPNLRASVEANRSTLDKR